MLIYVLIFAHGWKHRKLMISVFFLLRRRMVSTILHYTKAYVIKAATNSKWLLFCFILQCVADNFKFDMKKKIFKISGSY